LRIERRLSKPFARTRPGGAPPGGSRRRRPAFRAFTLTELMVVIAIIAILALCVMRAVGSATDRANVVRCVANLRNLHIALNNDVIDQGQWPQCPYEAGADGYDDWWIKELGKYNISQASWQCPTLMRSDREGKPDDKIRRMKIHYVPTAFDDNPATPRKWARQPWLIEVADAHGEGNLMVFPDGAIIGSNRYLSTHQ
jgi:prepilin-type N-terminal cleavage/methylation domain-containing protein